MPVIRVYAAIEVDLPDDVLWSEDQQNIVRPRGKNVIEAICRGLEDQGHPCSHVEQFEDSGWALTTSIDRRSVWVVFLDGAPLLLGVEAGVSLISWMSRSARANVRSRVIDAFDAAMKTSGKLRSIQWIDAPSASAAVHQFIARPRGNA